MNNRKHFCVCWANSAVKPQPQANMVQIKQLPRLCNNNYYSVCSLFAHFFLLVSLWTYTQNESKKNQKQTHYMHTWNKNNNLSRSVSVRARAVWSAHPSISEVMITTSALVRSTMATQTFSASPANSPIVASIARSRLPVVSNSNGFELLLILTSFAFPRMASCSRCPCDTHQ